MTTTQPHGQPDRGPVDGPRAFWRRREVAVLEAGIYPPALKVLQAHHDHGVPEPDVEDAYDTYNRRWGYFALVRAAARLRLSTGQYFVDDTAQELAQDAFVKLLKNTVRPGLFDPSRGEKALLSREISNRVKDYLNHKIRGEVITDDPTAGIEHGTEAGPDSAQDLLDEGFDEAGLDQTQTLIVHRKNAGFSSTEIAEELGLTPGAVDTAYWRAKNSLRAALTRILRRRGNLS